MERRNGSRGKGPSVAPHCPHQPPCKILVPLDTEGSSSGRFSVSPSGAACPAPGLDPATSQPSPPLHKCLMGNPGSLISPWGSSHRETFFLKISSNSQCYWEVGFNIHPINLPLRPFCPQPRITHYYKSGNKTTRNKWPTHCHSRVHSQNTVSLCTEAIYCMYRFKPKATFYTRLQKERVKRTQGVNAHRLGAAPEGELTQPVLEWLLSWGPCP